MTYVISDIHGEYDKLKEVLGKIGFGAEDTLYVLGDVIDRGPHPVKCLQLLMALPNAVCLAGNHEVMALDCLPFLLQEVTDESVDQISEPQVDQLLRWGVNGNSSTLDEFELLGAEERQDVIDFMGDLLPYEQIEVQGQKYLLVHAGLGNFRPDRALDDYKLDDLVWKRADYSKPYFEDTIVVSGHTPTLIIEECGRPGYVYRTAGHMAIDCGACFAGGRLGCVCLETGEEFYSEANK